MKRTIALCLLLVFSFGLVSQSFALTAYERTGNLANEESTWRYISGGGKVVLGGLLLAGGISIYAASRSNLLTFIALLPVSLAIGIPGAVTLGWGSYDLLFGSREYENNFSKLTLLNGTERENAASLYLQTKAEKDKADRQPSFWNGFGLFSMFETPAEREYKGYLKDQGK